MASALYTVQFLTLQGLGSGFNALVNYNSEGAPATFVIRDIAIYFGNPSPVLSNSVVIAFDRSDNGIPTAWAYNSGVTQSINPIYIHESVSLTSKNYLAETGQLAIFTVYNTSEGTNSVDVTVSGWVLPGTPALQTSVVVS